MNRSSLAVACLSWAACNWGPNVYREVRPCTSPGDCPSGFAPPDAGGAPPAFRADGGTGSALLDAGSPNADAGASAMFDGGGVVTSADAGGPSGTLGPCPTPGTTSGPLTIDGQSNVVLEGLKISSASGDCLVISNASQVTLRKSEIGPCAGRGIYVTGSTGVVITDNYIHPDTAATSCCDTHDGILADTSSGLLIQGNVVAYAESNIEFNGAVSDSQVIGNFLLNPQGPYPRGQQVQAWYVSRLVVRGNYGLSSTDTTRYALAENQEDAFNFGYSDSDGGIAEDNYITGGHSASGCGLIADIGANGWLFRNNSLLDTGQCGIGISSGTTAVVDGNRVLNRTSVPGAGNTAIYVWNQYAPACGPTVVSNNVASQLRPDGTESGYWNGGGCDPVTESNNTLDAAARALLSPPATQMPPPPIPPLPFECIAASPF